ncbi:MAG: hypothetical protein PQJ50_04585 [Spirochaetales bacterium]|nr:hypothetical protein [Spirochaetales bacterium]
MLQSQIDEAISNYDLDRITALKKIYTSPEDSRRLRGAERKLKKDQRRAVIRSRLIVQELEEILEESEAEENIIYFPGT